jgi:hypothetical protein
VPFGSQRFDRLKMLGTRFLTLTSTVTSWQPVCLKTMKSMPLLSKKSGWLASTLMASSKWRWSQMRMAKVSTSSNSGTPGETSNGKEIGVTTLINGPKKQKSKSN